jgi:Protein of unknown function (DUF433)
MLNAEFLTLPLNYKFKTMNNSGRNQNTHSTRVSLDSVVYRWLEGLSAETIAGCFPVLILEQVYGAIAYYLGHRVEIDAYLKAADDEYEAFRERVRANYPRLS